MSKRLTNSIFILIITILTVLLILSRLDFKFNILSKDNWISIIMGLLSFLPSFILSIIVFKLDKSANINQQKNEIDIFNKQLNADLREDRLKIFSTIMSLGVLNITSLKDFLISNFISLQTDKNVEKLNEIIAKEREVTDAYCRSKILFKDDEEINKIMEDVLNTFVEYRQEIQKFLSKMPDISNTAIIELEKKGYEINTPYIPIDLIYTSPDDYNMCKELFYRYYDEVDKKEYEIKKIITNENIIKDFEKYINIKKLEMD